VQSSSAPIPPQLPWIGLLSKMTPIDRPKMASPRIIIDNKPIQGSCGGIGADEDCTICGGDPQKCETLEAT
jgi:hypothetical protein